MVPLLLLTAWCAGLLRFKALDVCVPVDAKSPRGAADAAIEEQPTDKEAPPSPVSPLDGAAPPADV